MDCQQDGLSRAGRQNDNFNPVPARGPLALPAPHGTHFGPVSLNENILKYFRGEGKNSTKHLYNEVARDCGNNQKTHTGDRK